MRKIYTLTATEIKKLEQLPAIEGTAFHFWKTVAADRGLDYQTIIGRIDDRGNFNYQFSALPISKGKRKNPWCRPRPLKCSFDAHSSAEQTTSGTLHRSVT